MYSLVLEVTTKPPPLPLVEAGGKTGFGLSCLDRVDESIILVVLEPELLSLSTESVKLEGGVGLVARLPESHELELKLAFLDGGEGDGAEARAASEPVRLDLLSPPKETGFELKLLGPGAPGGAKDDGEAIIQLSRTVSVSQSLVCFDKLSSRRDLGARFGQLVIL